MQQCQSDADPVGEDNVELFDLYCSLAKTNDEQGKYDEALKWYLKELAIREKMSDKDHPSIATTCNNIALVYNNQGK
ncbi:MAG: tetratricopeptide repeat protein, partial [Tannerella sp.]|nr:tetratricopeptide repeat protein [Tannerella sp.]